MFVIRLKSEFGCIDWVSSSKKLSEQTPRRLFFNEILKHSLIELKNVFDQICEDYDRRRLNKVAIWRNGMISE